MTETTELKQKVELRFGKRGPLRFISHHDMMRLMERACRRAGLPLRYSSGFNPRPRIVLPVPLEVGVESDDEPAEIELSGWLPVPEIRKRFGRAFPRQMPVHSIRLLPPKRQSQPAVEMVYNAYPAEAGIDLSEQAVAEFITRESIPWERERPNKTVRLDLRKGVKSLSFKEDVLNMRLTPGKGSVRPYEVLEYLLRSREQALLVPVRRVKTLLAPVEVGGRSVRKKRRR